MILILLRCGNFAAELGDTAVARGHKTEPEEAVPLDKEEEFGAVRTWFNANKRFKVREVVTQTTDPYDDVQIASDNVLTETAATMLEPRRQFFTNIRWK